MKLLITQEQLLLLSKKVVLKYYSRGVIPESDIEDVQMSLVERFLSQQDHLKKSYKGNARISTFCVAVLNNYCREYIRKAMQVWQNENAVDVVIAESPVDNALKEHAIKDEVAYLKRVLLLQGDTKARLHVELTYFFELPMLVSFLQAYDIYHKKHNLQNLYVVADITKGEKYKVMAKGIKLAENKDMKPDAVRMRFQKSLKHLIALMNGVYRRACYSSETFQTLYEYYYMFHKISKEEGHE
ncbi:MAG: hypothetical protein R6U66_13240 [Bacteroidales bacterium]|jgi:hypothetical protein